MSVTINGTTGINNSGSDSASGGYTGTLTGNASTASAPANGSTLALQSAKAWVNFNGTLTGTISPRSSYNVSSITKNGTGDYTVNFTTPIADTNYAYAIDGITSPTTFSTTSFRYSRLSTNGSPADVTYLSLIIFGN